MSIPAKELWRDVLKKFSKIEEINDDTIYELQQIMKRNPDLANQKDIIEELKRQCPGIIIDQALCPEVPKSMANTAFSHSNELVSFIQQSVTRIEEIEKFNSTLLDQEKPFSDLVLKGPTNSAEASLLQSATQFLEPQEFRDAVNSKASIGSMVQKVGASKIRGEINHVLVAAHLEWVNNKSKEKPEAAKDLGNFLNQRLEVFGEVLSVMPAGVGKSFVEEAAGQNQSLPNLAKDGHALGR